MPSSSFFSGLDQVSEQPKKSHRHNHGFPSSLHDSPYLSSPIRPIPSFSRNTNRSSNMSVSSKRSKRVSCGSRATSPAQSTVGSLRLTSPYSESIFSLHSLCTTSSKRTDNERQSLSRTVLLPNEIDDLAKHFNVQTRNNLQKHHNDLKGEYGGDDNDEKYDMSDFDDDSTIESNAAKSICDEQIFQKMQTEGTDDELLYRHQDVVPNEVSIEGEDGLMMKHNKGDVKESTNSPEIKLPSVNTNTNTEGDRNHQVLTLTTPERKQKLKHQQQQQDRSSDSSLMRSPYAANQSKFKRSTRKKKKSNESVRSSKGHNK